VDSRGRDPASAEQRDQSRKSRKRGGDFGDGQQGIGLFQHFSGASDGWV
jgi:hypothetical protein